MKKATVKEWIDTLPQPYLGEAYNIRIISYFTINAYSLDQAIRLGCKNCIQRKVILDAIARGEFDPKGEARMEVAAPHLGNPFVASELGTTDQYSRTHSDEVDENSFGNTNDHPCYVN